MAKYSTNNLITAKGEPAQVQGDSLLEYFLNSNRAYHEARRQRAVLKPGIIGQGADIIATPFVWLYYGCSGLSQFCAHTKQYFSPAKDTAQELAHDEPSLTSNKDDKVVERNNTSDLEKIMQKQKL